MNALFSSILVHPHPPISLYKYTIHLEAMDHEILAYKSSLKILKNQRKVAKFVTSLPNAINPNQGH